MWTFLGHTKMKSPARFPPRPHSHPPSAVTVLSRGSIRAWVSPLLCPAFACGQLGVGLGLFPLRSANLLGAGLNCSVKYVKSEGGGPKVVVRPEGLWQMGTKGFLINQPDYFSPGFSKSCLLLLLLRWRWLYGASVPRNA